MKYFHLHPDDARWFRRWLRNNLACFAVIVGFLLTLRIETSVPVVKSTIAQADSPPQHDEPRTMAIPSVDPNPRQQIAQRPKGWRRTNRGWEHVSTWPAPPRPLGEIIARQQAREPAWFQHFLAKLRSIPPVTFGMFQIAAITVIVNLGRGARQSPKRAASTSDLVAGGQSN